MVNILLIHQEILDNFNKQRNELETTRIKIQELEHQLETRQDVIEVNELETQIDALKNAVETLDVKENIYKSTSYWDLECFKKFKNEPIIVDFTSNNRTEKKKDNSYKQEIINRYLSIAEIYIDVSPYIIKQIKPSEVSGKDTICECCGKKMRHINDEMICSNCGLKSNELESFTTYKDIDRVNIASNYQYDMRQHLRNCLDKYQGKEKTVIPKELYEKLQAHINGMGLRLENISTGNIIKFLKEFDYSKYYNNVHKIHHELTGIPLPDLSMVEDKVLKDIDAISNIFHEVKENRKNFINAQLTICMLLRRNGYKCSLRDFHSIDTPKRLKDHIETYYKIEQKLGWPHTSFT